MPEYEVSVIFSNDKEEAITLVLEPWGEIYRMEPHARVTINFHSHVPPVAPQSVEVEYGVDLITVYGWEDCTATLFQAGVEIGAGIGPRSRVPQGLAILKDVGFFQQTMNATLSSL